MLAILASQGYISKLIVFSRVLKCCINLHDLLHFEHSFGFSPVCFFKVSPHNIITTKCFVAQYTFYCICSPSVNLPTPVHCRFSLINTDKYCRELWSVGYQINHCQLNTGDQCLCAGENISLSSDNMLLYFNEIVNFRCPNPNHDRFFERRREEKI